MNSTIAAAERLPPVDIEPQPESRRAAWTARAACLLPGALVAFLGFHAGGFFAGTTAGVAAALAVALLLRLMLAEHPFAGFGPALLVAVASLALFAAWTLLSATWSGASSRALLEFDRVLVYLLVLVLAGSAARSAERIRWMMAGVAGAILAIGGAGLISRTLPHLLVTAPNIQNNRLSYPLTYWNTLGMLCAVGVVLCFHMASSEREPAALRVLGAAAVPVLATSVFFTFSRGGIAAGVVGIVVYVLVAHPRSLLVGLVTTVPATAIALVVAAHAPRLASDHPTTVSATGQGHRVALAVALCALGAALVRLLGVWVDRRLARIRLPWRPSARTRWGAAIAVLIVVVAAALALGAPSTLDRQWKRFVSPASVSTSGNLSQRLTNPGNNGRIEHWRVAVDAFLAHPLHGNGAGTYENLWSQHRRLDFSVVHAHSLYVGVLGELGLVGLILILIPILAILVVLARRSRGRHRALYGGIFAASVAWALHTGVDWDWQMPGAGLWVFALGGLALARPLGAPVTARMAPSRTLRLAAGVACLVLAFTPALVAISQAQLDRSTQAFRRGDCTTATSHALSAANVLGTRPEPFEILGLCDASLHRANLSVEMISRAVARDPHDWQYVYELALVRGAAGLDPRAAAQKALHLNPLEPITRQLARNLASDKPQTWRRVASTATLPF